MYEQYCVWTNSCPPQGALHLALVLPRVKEEKTPRTESSDDPTEALTGQVQGQWLADIRCLAPGCKDVTGLAVETEDVH